MISKDKLHTTNQTLRFIAEYDLALSLVFTEESQDHFLDKRTLAFILKLMGFTKSLSRTCEPINLSDRRLFEELTKVISLNDSLKIHKNDFLQLLMAIQGIRIRKSDYADLHQRGSIYSQYFDSEVLELSITDIESIKNKFKQMFMNRIHSNISSNLASIQKVEQGLAKLYTQQLLRESISNEFFESCLQGVLNYYQAETKLLKVSVPKRRDSIEADLNNSVESKKRKGLNRLLRPVDSAKSQNSAGSESRGSLGARKADDSRDSMKVFRSMNIPSRDNSNRNSSSMVDNLNSVYYDKNKMEKKLNFSQYLSEDEELETPEIYRAFYSKDLELDRTDIYSKPNSKSKPQDHPIGCIYDVGSKHQSRKTDLLEKILAKSINLPATGTKTPKASHRSMSNEMTENHLDFDKLKSVIDRVANEFSRF